MPTKWCNSITIIYTHPFWTRNLYIIWLFFDFLFLFSPSILQFYLIIIINFFISTMQQNKSFQFSLDKSNLIQFKIYALHIETILSLSVSKFEYTINTRISKSFNWYIVLKIQIYICMIWFKILIYPFTLYSTIFSCISSIILSNKDAKICMDAGLDMIIHSIFKFILFTLNDSLAVQNISFQDNVVYMKAIHYSPQLLQIQLFDKLTYLHLYQTKSFLLLLQLLVIVFLQLLLMSHSLNHLVYIDP